jgi:hypothetical protein
LSFSSSTWHLADSPSQDKSGNDQGFKARAQAAAANNTNAGNTGNSGSNKSSSGKK